MSIRTIQVPLPGERVVGLSPETASEAATDWLRRPNLFPGRALTAASLQQRQAWQAGHIAERGQDWTAGVVEGLEVSLKQVSYMGDAPTYLGINVVVSKGRGLTVTGEDVVLNSTLECQLSDLRVVAPSGFFIDGSGVGPASMPGEPLRGREVGKVPTPAQPVAGTLGSIPVAANLPSLAVLVLRPVTVDVANLDSMDPCDRCACDEGSVDDATAFEDWRIGDGVELVWYVWPEEWLPIPAVPPEQLRNAAAWGIFQAEAQLAVGDCLPWEAWGVPIALLGSGFDAMQTIDWCDRASVVRQGGRGRDARLQYANGVLSANDRLPMLWQAQIEQFAEQIAAAGDPSPDAATLAQAFGSHLPPVGLLPKNAFDPATRHSDFFPANFDLDAAPVPVDQLDIVVRANAPLAPLDLAAGESVRVLVPVPLQSWEPRLLITETIDPEFQQTLDNFLLVRSRELGERQGLRVRQSVLVRSLSGSYPSVPAWNDDPAALEAETLDPWGAPPAGGGHRNSLRAGIHQHYFLQASETLTVATDRFYVWVCLNPDNPPRTLMLQWHSAGSWEHRAYWGENLINWGVDATASRMHIGDLPTAGKWVRLETPVGAVGLPNGSIIDGIAFTLYDGQAAYGFTGQGAAGPAELKWFCNVLPAGAQIAGDESFELLTQNDLWAPFRDTDGVLPAIVTAPPSTMVGGHYDTQADGVHQHFFDSATPFQINTGENLFCWVYLDPSNPPSEVMLQWLTQDGSWEHRAFWGWDQIGWGTAGTASRAQIGALPAPGSWVRLELAAATVGLSNAKVVGMAFTLSGGSASFGAAGAGVPVNGVIASERAWFAGALPGGAIPRGAVWNYLDVRQMRVPSLASVRGQVQAIANLYQHPALQVLSAQERAQLYIKGLAGFIDMVRSRADRADDLVNHHFLQVQTDIYRVRQLMLGTTDASRLAVSPTLANIAQADTAVATQTQLADFVSNLNISSSSSASDSGAVMMLAASSTGSSSTAQKAALLNTSLISSNVSSDFISSKISIGGLIGSVGGSVSDATDVLVAKNLAASTAIQPILKASTIGFTSTPSDVINASPLVGQSLIRTTTIAERLADPKSKVAHDYATATRFAAVQTLLAYVQSLTAEDGNFMPGLFNGIEVRGLAPVYTYSNGVATSASFDAFLQDLNPSVSSDVRSRPLTDFISNTALLGKLMTPPSLGAADEAGFFSHTTDLSDNVVTLMRSLEGRIQSYRDIVTLCQQTFNTLTGNVSAINNDLSNVGDKLAEARHDVSVARALIAEELDRLAAVNARRQKTLAEEVKFLAFIRPRETDNLLATPTHAVDPGLLDAPVPACLATHPDVPDELIDMLRVVREAPANWFVKAPPILLQLDKIDNLVRLVQSSQLRAAAGIATPVLAAQASAGGVLGAAIARVASRQLDMLAPRIAAVQAVSIASFANTTWNGIRAQAEQVVSFADLTEGGHGRADVAKLAAAELDNMRSIIACLHAEFSGTPAVLRLEWATTLSEFDAAPNLRNLANLSRWTEIDYTDRRQMQAYVDWLFAQIQPNQSQAVGLINDVVRMCLLLASHAPVDRIIAGRMAQAVTGVSPGIRIPLTVFNPAQLRVGMQALLYRGESLIARANVEDIGQQQVSAYVVHTATDKVDLGDDVRVHFDNAAAVSLNVAASQRTLFRV